MGFSRFSCNLWRLTAIYWVSVQHTFLSVILSVFTGFSGVSQEFYRCNSYVFRVVLGSVEVYRSLPCFDILTQFLQDFPNYSRVVQVFTRISLFIPPVFDGVI